MLPITGTSAGYLEINDPEEMHPIQNPIQSALLQLQELNLFYMERRVDREDRVVARCLSAVLSPLLGAVATIVVAIWVPVTLKNTLACGKPSNQNCLWSEPPDKRCIEDYDWCAPMNYIGNVLWSYVNNNQNQYWAQNIYMGSDYGNEKVFINGLIVVCNKTTGTEGSRRLNVDFHASDVALIGAGITLFSHFLGQIFTCGLTSLGLEKTPLSFREYYRLHRNIIDLKSYKETQRLTLLSQEPSDLPLVEIDPAVLEESERIFWEQTRRYCLNLTSVILFATEMILLIGIWVAASKKWGTTMDDFKDDPFKYVTKPSHCQRGTYEIGFNSNQNRPRGQFPIPGGIQVLMNSTYPYERVSSEIINIFAVGIFTAFIAPGLHTVIDLSSRLFCRLRN